jgi:ElaB/YqjD/DUF883 family membrane-anchored ribosome-binding protein
MPTRNVEQEFDALRSDFAKLGSDLKSLTHAMGNLTGQEARDYSVRLRAALGHVGEDVDAMASSVAVGSRKGAAEVSRCVGEHPLTSILLCLGLGLVIGKLIDR